MRIAASIVALCLALMANQAFAVQVETFSTSNKESKDVALVEAEAPFSFDFNAEETYVGNGDVERGSLSVRDFHESDTRIHFILTPLTKIGILRLGVQTERYSFSFGSTAPIPNRLHSTALV